MNNQGRSPAENSFEFIAERLITDTELHELAENWGSHSLFPCNFFASAINFLGVSTPYFLSSAMRASMFLYWND
jgi:hypothetical protein